MNIDIKDIQGQTRVSVPIQEEAKGVFTLMSADYIQLPFSTSEVIPFRLGDYADLSGIEFEGLGGKIAKVYEIVDIDNATPTYNESTGGYDYTLRLDAYYWKWKNKIFKYTPENAGQEASWSLTAALDVHLGVFLRNLKALGYTYKGTDFTYSIDDTVENKAVAVTYDNINLLDALFTLASEDYYNCDCWITDNVIHFGRNEFGDAVTIERGVEAESITKSESKGTYATRIYAFGGTRNIPTNYRPTDEQTVVNGVVQKRLMLPEGTPYIDAYENMTTEEAIEDVVVFDDIYPRRVGTISDVTTRTETVTDEDGTEREVTYYRYKDTGLVFDEKYIIEGQELNIIFQSGKLNGMEFGVIFNPDDKAEPEQLWEIVANEDYGRLLPDEVIYPENGDTYVLSGFDIQLVSDQYIPEAEQELLERAQAYAEQAKKDDGTYTATLFSDYVYEDQLRHNYEFGQKVNLIDKAYFENGRESRILGWEINLDIPFDSPKYTVGESMPYSRIGDIEDKVDSLTYKGQTYTGSGGSGVYIIRTNDSTAPSDSNVFSAKRSLATLLRKDREDETDYLLRLLGGIITPFLESPDYIAGVIGAGFSVRQNENKQSFAEFDKLSVRLKATFQILEILKTELGGSDMMFNSSGARIKITKVERLEQEVYFVTGDKAYFSNDDEVYFPDIFRCYFLADDTEEAVENLFKVGDFAMSQSFNIKEGVYENVSNHYWWRKVVGVGDDYIDLSTIEMDEDSDDPEAGDVVVQLGNETDTDRQNAIIISAFGNNAPYISMFQGIDGYSLSEKAIFTVGYDRVNNECYLIHYGRAYLGYPDRKNYIEFKKDTGLVIKAKSFIFESGEDVSEELESVRTSITALDGKISLKVSKDELYDTGIDIDEKTVTVTAESFFVNNSIGSPIAVFTTDSSCNPILKADYIDVENLKVKHLDGADGTFEGILKAKNIYTRISNSGTDIDANGTIDPNTDVTSIFGSNNSFGIEPYNTIKMPNVSEWEGLKIEACTVLISRNDLGLFLQASDNNLFRASTLEGYKYCIVPDGILTTFVAVMIGVGYWIPDNSLVKYSNDLSTWYDYDGNPA